ncbi:MAG: hypothetical protein ABSB88_19340 [Bryobacteraceae bacterium]|jgi:hypothetical protein
MRDREFCSAAHRKSYGARLGKALKDLAAPEPPPAAVAGFRIDMPLQSGNLNRSVAVWEFGHGGSAFEWRDAWPVSIGGVRGQGAKALAGSHWAPFAPDLCAGSHAGPSVYCPDIQFPRFELAAEDSMPLGSGEVAESPPLAGAAFWEIPEASNAACTMATQEVARRTALILEPAAMAMVAAPLVIGIRGLVAAPAADAVEALLPPAPYAGAVAFPAAAFTLAWVLKPADELGAAPEICGPVPTPAAEVVEALLPVTPYAEAMALPAAVDMGSVQALDPADELSLALEGCGAAAAPAAEAVETLLPPAPYAGEVAFPAAVATVSAWVPEPISEVSLQFEGCGVMAAPAAEVVEALLPPAPYADAAAFPAATTAATGVAWMLEPADVPSLVLEGRGAMAAPPPEAAETLIPATPMARAVEFRSSAVRLPELALAAVPEADTETAENVSEPADVALPSESWMTPPPACEAEREVWPVEAAALPLEAAIQVPGAAALAIAEPMMRESAGWLLAPLAEPVVAYVSARLAESIAGVALQPAAFCVPDLVGLGLAGRRQSAPAAPAAEQRMPNPASPERGSSLAAEPAAAGAGVIRFPDLVLAQTTGSSTGAFRVSEAGVAAPETAIPDGRAARLDPLFTISIVPPTTGADQPGAAFPQGQLVPMEFFCQRVPMVPRRNLAWLTRSIPAAPPRFAMRTAFNRLEDLALIPMERERETPSFTEIFSIANAARRAQHSRLRAPARAVAAALLMAVGLWFGAGSAKIGRELLAVNTRWPSVETPSSSAGRDFSAAFARVRSVFVPPAPRPSEGPLEKISRAIQSRAAAELSDTFRGMEAWGAAAAALPAGWSRHADGYIRTGQLALYHPSLNFTDYRLEFFGQIESKGMGWAVRASDPKNYYAMKFKVMEPGLRPVLAAVHYPVVGGKPGERVETPLSVMIHNRTPYHVAVDVKGNRVTTSIEGEEVDSWTDDSLKTGGVGFFSDAGESAHLYWMKITKNQDWLGRVCAYLSGNAGSTETGDLWRDDDAPAPASRPSPRPSPDAILAAVESEEFLYHSPHRARILTNGRTEPCKS